MGLSSEGNEHAHGLRPGRMLRALAVERLAPLVPTARWAQLLSLADQFPAVVHTVCFESRLARDDERIDLAFLLLPGVELRAVSADIQRADRSVAWRRWASFLAEWTRPNSPWTWRIPFVCVAFDLDQPFVQLPEPCVSLCVDPDFFARRLGIGASRPLDGQDLVELASECHALFADEALPEPVAARLLACAAADGIEAKHLSFMLSRPSGPMKLDVRLRRDALAGLLDRIGFPARAALEGWVRELVPEDQHIQLNLVLKPDLSLPLEVELLTGDGARTSDARLALLERLVARGLASAEKVQVLRDTWLRPASSDAGVTTAFSWYLKLRVTESGPSDVKAYLAAMPRRLALTNTARVAP